MAEIARGPSLTDQVADSLRARIVEGALALGEPLSEIALASELGVSKTPVREALLQLRRDGLVEIHPQRGTYVFTMTADQVSELSEARGILETAALRLAMARNGAGLVAAWAEIVARMEVALAAGDAAQYRVLDGDFHRAFIELSENRYLLEAFNGLAFRVQALRNRLSLDPALNHASLADHAELLGLARRGALDAMLARAARHVEATRDHYVARLGATEPPARRARGRGGAAGT